MLIKSLKRQKKPAFPDDTGYIRPAVLNATERDFGPMDKQNMRTAPVSPARVPVKSGLMPRRSSR